MLTAAGPNRIAPRPVPVMCEQLPVTDGILSEDRTKAYAPTMAWIMISFRFPESVFFMEKKPAIKNGTQTTPQAMQNLAGR